MKYRIIYNGHGMFQPQRQVETRFLGFVIRRWVPVYRESSRGHWTDWSPASAARVAILNDHRYRMNRHNRYKPGTDVVVEEIEL